MLSPFSGILFADRDEQSSMNSDTELTAAAASSTGHLSSTVIEGSEGAVVTDGPIEVQGLCLTDFLEHEREQGLIAELENRP